MALLMLLLAVPSLHDRLRLSCEKEGHVDVRDFGACGMADLTPAQEAEAIKMAEQLARLCIPGRILPVRYCPAKPSS